MHSNYVDGNSLKVISIRSCVSVYKLQPCAVAEVEAQRKTTTLCIVLQNVLHGLIVLPLGSF